MQKSCFSARVLEEAKSRGTYLTVSDKEHVDIIRIYMEQGEGIAAIGTMLHRSSRTPLEHINAHNKSDERSEFCAACESTRRILQRDHEKRSQKGRIKKGSVWLITTNITTTRERKREKVKESTVLSSRFNIQSDVAS